jgi:hypothetical protein
MVIRRKQLLLRLLTIIAPTVNKAIRLIKETEEAIQKGNELWDEVEEALHTDRNLQAKFRGWRNEMKDVQQALLDFRN